MDATNKNIPQVGIEAHKVHRVQEKLDILLGKTHELALQAKMLKGEAVDFESFIKVSNRTSLGGKMKGKLQTQKEEWANMDTMKQYEILHNLALEYTRVSLNFDSLEKAIKTTQKAVAIRKALNLEKQALDKGEGPTVSDPEEVKYLEELLDEQAELAEKIIDLEEKRVQHELDLLGAKCELMKELAATRQVYSDINQEEPENAVGPATPRRKKGKSVLTDRNGAKASKLEEKQDQLLAEEDRLNQMRVFIQKLMLSTPNSGMSFDEETNKRHKTMMIKCGEDLATLRGD